MPVEYVTINTRNASAQIPVEMPERLTNDAGTVNLDYTVTLTNLPQYSDAIKAQTGTGRIIQHNGQDLCLRFADIKINKQPLIMRVENKPLVAELVANAQARKAAFDVVQEQAWEDARQAERERDEALRADMHKRAEALIATIPTPASRVTVTKTGSVDGDSSYKYEADGLKFERHQVTIVGTEEATRPGALNAFDSITVAYVTAKQVRERRAEVEAKQQAQAQAAQSKAETRAAQLKQAQETGKPVIIHTDSELINGKEEFYEIGTHIYVRPDGTEYAENFRRVVG